LHKKGLAVKLNAQRWLAVRTLSEEEIKDEYVRKMTPSENFGLQDSILPYGSLFNGCTAMSDAPMSSRSLHSAATSVYSA
jgi:hypothetical protein